MHNDCGAYGKGHSTPTQMNKVDLSRKMQSTNSQIEPYHALSVKEKGIMLNSKFEKMIFIIVYIVLFVVAGYYATQIKANYLPINIDLTPEQIIEAEFKEIDRENLHYSYLIKDDFLIACIESTTGQGTLHTAYKNDISGFMFDIPGTTVGSIRESRHSYTILKDDSVLFITILKYKSKYVILIEDLLQKREIDVYVNDEILVPLTTSYENNTCWADVLSDSSKVFETKCVFEGNTYHIVDNQEINDLFGGER